MHAIIAIGLNTTSNDVRHDMTSSPFENTHIGTTSGMACQQLLWTLYMVGLRQAWHAIMDLGPHIRLDDGECGLPLSPFDITHNVGQPQAWYPIIVLRKHTHSDVIGRGNTIIALGKHT